MNVTAFSRLTRQAAKTRTDQRWRHLRCPKVILIWKKTMCLIVSEFSTKNVVNTRKSYHIIFNDSHFLWDLVSELTIHNFFTRKSNVIDNIKDVAKPWRYKFQLLAKYNAKNKQLIKCTLLSLLRNKNW